jgi:maltodextrin utilization protein YvdJ
MKMVTTLILNTGRYIILTQILQGKQFSLFYLKKSMLCSPKNWFKEGFKLLLFCGDEEALAMTLLSAYSHHITYITRFK